MRIISSAEVRRWLTWDVALESMREAFKALSMGLVMMPVRSVLSLEEAKTFGVMPCYLRYQGIVGAKLISIFPNNAPSGRPSHQGVIALFSVANGEPLAVVDADELTAIRTAAVSALATEILAHRNASVLAVLGAGQEARTHIQALSHVRAFDTIRIWGPREARVHALISEMADSVSASLHYASTIDEAVFDADVICTVTSANTPLLFSSQVKNGAHINAVGASKSTARELDSQLVKRSTVYVDSLAAAWQEAGDLLIPLSEGVITRHHVQWELGDLLCNGREAPVRSPDEVTIFKSLGVAVEDIAAAYAVYQRVEGDSDGELRTSDI